MGKAERDKGNRGERQVVKLFKDAGFTDATRNYKDKLDGLGVDVFAGRFEIQVKMRKNSVPMSMYYEIKSNDGIKLLASKVNRKPWMVTLSLQDFLDICGDIGIVYKGVIDAKGLY